MIAIPTFFDPDAPEYTTNVPQALAGNGKDFEQALLDSAVRMKDRLIMGRYGVNGVYMRGANGKMEWRPVSSRPDFDVTFFGGATANVEAKVCAGPSFSLSEDKLKASQYDWMRGKASYGVPCYLIIHFNARTSKAGKINEPAFTVSLQVHPELQLWRDYEAGIRKSISREEALAFGTLIPWTIPPRARKALPHFI